MTPELAERSHEWARRIVQMEMKRRSVSYPELTKRLNDAGVDENERNLRNKIGRGEFATAYMLVCMKVMGAQVIPVAEWAWGGDEG